jgi:deazaflavin-dependent oxidoreductase (nitroreductase family)
MAKPLFRFFNRIHIFLYRLTAGSLGGRIQGLRVLLLTTKGRRSGKERTVPLGFFEDGGAWVITASNAGFDVHPGWFFNLRSDSRVRVEVGGKISSAQAQIVDGEERVRLWNRLISQSPGYARYEKSTKRVIPLIAIRRASHPGGGLPEESRSVNW